MHVPLARTCAALTISAVLLAGCGRKTARTTDATGPEQVVGAFLDDYGITYTIAHDIWQQHPDPPLRVVEWNSAAQFLIVENASSDSSDSQQFTRVDWITLDGYAPYTWAYCYTVYDAKTVALARAADPPGRDTPRTGCNGFPFSRMRAADR